MLKFEKISEEEYISYFRSTCPPNYDINIDAIKAEYQRLRIPERESVGSACYTIFSPVDVRLTRYDTSFVTVPTGFKFVSNKNDVACMIYPHTYYGSLGHMELADSVHIVNADDYKGDNEGHIILRFRAAEDISIPAGTPLALAMITPYLLTDDDDCQYFKTPSPKPEPEHTEAPQENASMEPEQMTMEDIESVMNVEHASADKDNIDG